MTVLTVICSRVRRNDRLRFAVQIRRDVHGAPYWYSAVIMTPEPDVPRPGDHHLHGRIDQRLNLGGRP